MIRILLEPESFVGQNVRALREKKNISLNELARQAGISSSTLSQIERGDGNPTERTIRRLARALDVSLQVVMGEKFPEEEIEELREIPAFLVPIIMGVNEILTNPTFTLKQKTYLQTTLISFSNWLLKTISNGQPLSDAFPLPQPQRATSDIVDDELLFFSLESGIRNRNLERIRALYSQAMDRMRYTSRFGEMQRCVEELIKLVGDAEDPFRLELSYDLAYAYLMLGEYELGIEECEKGIHLAQKFENQKAEAHMWWLAGEHHRMIGDYRRGLDACRRARAIYEKIKEEPSAKSPGPMWALWNIARIHTDLGNYDDALDELHQLYHQGQRTNLLEAVACALWGLASRDLIQGRYQDALKGFGEARQWANYDGNKYWEATSLWGIAKTLGKLSHLDQALVVARAGMRIFKDLGNEGAAGWLVCSMADIQVMQGEYDDAENNYSKALEVLEETKERKEKATALLGHATLQLISGSDKEKLRYREILDQYREAKEMCKDISKYFEARAMLGIAETLCLMGQQDDAITKYTKVYQESKLFGHRLEEAHALLGIAKAKRLKEETSLKECNEAFEIYQGLDAKWGIVHALIERVLNQVGNETAVSKDLEQARRISQEVGLNPELRLIQKILETNGEEVHTLAFS